MAEIATGWNADADVRATGVELNDLLWVQNGVNRNRKTDGTRWWLAGIPAPSSNCAGSESAGAGNMDAGTYYVVYTFYDDRTGAESNPSTVSAAIVLTSSVKGIDLTSVDVDSDAADTGTSTNQRKIYRTVNGGSSAGPFFYAGVIDDNSTTTKTITVADSALGELLGRWNDANGLSATPTVTEAIAGTVFELVTYEGHVMPACQYASVHNNHLFMAGDVAHTTGDVDVVNASTAVIKGTVSPAFTQAHVGKRFRVDGNDKEYLIKSVTDADNLVLASAYDGTGAQDQSYSIYGQPNRIYHSGYTYPERFSLAYDYVGFDEDDGDWITGLAEFHGRVYAFKNNKVGVIRGADRPFPEPDLLPTPYGAVSGWSIVQVDGRLYYAGRRDFYYIAEDGRSVVSIGHDFITNTYGDLSDARKDNIVAGLDEEQGCIRFAVPGADQADTIAFVYNYIYEKWAIYDCYGCNAYGRVMDENGIMQLLSGQAGTTSGGTTKAKVFQENAAGYGDGNLLSESYRGTATAGGNTTLTDSGATFNTTDDGLADVWVYIESGTGAGQLRPIFSNTATVLTIPTGQEWDTNPSTDSVYIVGHINQLIRSGWVPMNDHMEKSRVYYGQVITGD